jgi:hypothetical protein
VHGDENWSGDFQLPSQFTSIVPGTYSNLQRYPFYIASGGLSWIGEGRGCNTSIGSVIIDSITYTGGLLTSVDLRFEQHCEGGVTALRGTIHWKANDNVLPPGPIFPAPSSLWQPPSWFAAPTGNYVFLQSDSADYIGGGINYIYTQANATLSVSAAGGHLTVGVGGDQNWSGNFTTMTALTSLRPGYYGQLERYPFNNPVKGGLDWEGDGRGCNTLTGWFVVDSITYSNGALSSIDLRFEQHCEGGGPALHGRIHWAPGDTTAPAGPVVPAPASLWQPPSAALPASGDFAYLQSDSGDYIGGGATNLYTGTSAPVVTGVSATHVSVGVGGWSGDFQGMNSLSRLEPGYYGNLQRYPFNNPVTGGLDWSGNGSGCNTLSGWFVVDSITYVGVTLTAIELRFEQHCEGVTAAMRGKIRWHSAP